MYTKFIKNKFTHKHLKNNHITTMGNNNSKSKSSKGFTLVEIMVSIMLIAIFLVIFGPPIVDMFKEIVNSSDNDASFNNAYNLAANYASKGVDVSVADSGLIACDDTFPGDITITLHKPDGSIVDGKNFAMPFVRFYYANYDTGSFGNARELCFNDYYVALKTTP